MASIEPTILGGVDGVNIATGRGEDYGSRDKVPIIMAQHMLDQFFRKSLLLSSSVRHLQNAFFRRCRHDGMIDSQNLVQPKGHDSSLLFKSSIWTRKASNRR